MSKRWGPWQLSNDGAVLYQEGQQIQHDWVDLTRCTTSAEVLDTIFHTCRHVRETIWSGSQSQVLPKSIVVC